MKIVKMDNQGRGITYNNEKIVFVNNALKDEDVEINIILDKKRYSIADVSQYNKTSKIRTKPACKYYDICGGCQLQHISYINQLKYKEEYLNEIFKAFNTKISSIESSTQFYYRNKITLHIDNKIGLYKKNSTQLIEIEKCLIVNKKINEKLKYIKNIDLNGIDNIIIKSFNNNEILIINGNHKKIDISKIEEYFDNIYINNNLIKGKRITAEINKIKYLISPNAFFQVNIEIAEKMLNNIKSICNKINAKNVIDLYCGCGSISLYIAKEVNYVYGVEINPQSINDAIQNKIINNINNADFVCNTSDNISINEKYDTIIVDPPRNGLSKKIINKIINSNVKNIIYVSCDPVTLKRDLIYLKEKFLIESIKAYDMFPNTYHAECIVLLKAK